MSSIAELEIPGHLLLLLLLVCAFSRDGISMENMVNVMPQWFNLMLPKPIGMTYHITGVIKNKGYLANSYPRHLFDLLSKPGLKILLLSNTVIFSCTNSSNEARKTHIKK